MYVNRVYFELVGAPTKELPWWPERIQLFQAERLKRGADSAIHFRLVFAGDLGLASCPSSLGLQIAKSRSYLCTLGPKVGMIYKYTWSPRGIEGRRANKLAYCQPFVLQGLQGFYMSIGGKYMFGAICRTQRGRRRG